MPNSKWPPKIVMVLLGMQFFGIFLMITSTVLFEPLLVAISFAAGTGLLAGAALLWVLALLKEITTLRPDIEKILDKNKDVSL